MKAVFCTTYGPPEVLQIKEVEKPVPKDNEVLIKTYSTTVTAADYKVRGFKVPFLFWLPARLMLGLKRPRKPVLGMELSGVVESVGKNVTLYKEGDEVFASTLQTFGAYAEYKCMSEDGPIALKPSNLSFGSAATVPIGARTALHYLKDLGNIKSGQKVLIYGASGSVGTYAVQLAKYYGADVTGVCSTTNLELVKSLGADKVIDYTKSDFIDSFETYDIIFATVDKCPFSVYLKVLNENGIYLNIGRPIPSLQMTWTSLSTNKKIVVGESSAPTAEDLVILSRIIEKGQLKPVIDRSYPMNQIVEAHRYADQGHKKGNVVITVKQ